MGLFIRLFHIIDGHRIELGDVTRGSDGLVFTAQYNRALNTHQLWQIMQFMIDHKYHRADEIADNRNNSYNLDETPHDNFRY